MRRSIKTLGALSLGFALLTSAGCGSSSGDGTVAAATDSGGSASVDTSALEAAIAELQAKVDELSGRFVTNADGSSGFAPATAPEVVTDSTYGFAFPLPAGVTPTYSGLAGDEANNESGSLVASAGGVSVLLLWLTDENPLTPSESVVSSFEVLQSSSGLEFALLASGEDSFTVDGQDAAYATFTATEGEATVGVAVIGGWSCEAGGRSFALTVTGTEQESVSTSFFELVNAFGCEA